MTVNQTIQGIKFEWDDAKARTNQIKHKVSFESACEVFFDPFLQPDKEEVIDDELRETVIGLTKRWQLLFVAYTMRKDTIRIISARNATPHQKSNYENQ